MASAIAPRLSTTKPTALHCHVQRIAPEMASVLPASANALLDTWEPIATSVFAPTCAQAMATALVVFATARPALMELIALKPSAPTAVPRMECVGMVLAAAILDSNLVPTEIVLSWIAICVLEASA